MITEEKAGNPRGFGVDERTGALQAPLDASAPEVWEHVSRNGGEAHAAVEAHEEARGFRHLCRFERALDNRHRRILAQANRRLQDLTQLVVRRLRLRKLVHDQAISKDQYRAGCYRLLKHADRLVGPSEGLSLRLSDGNRVPGDGSVIDLSWEFSM